MYHCFVSIYDYLCVICFHHVIMFHDALMLNGLDEIEFLGHFGQVMDPLIIGAPFSAMKVKHGEAKTNQGTGFCSFASGSTTSLRLAHGSETAPDVRIQLALPSRMDISQGQFANPPPSDQVLVSALMEEAMAGVATQRSISFSVPMSKVWTSQAH